MNVWKMIKTLCLSQVFGMLFISYQVCMFLFFIHASPHDVYEMLQSMYRKASSRRRLHNFIVGCKQKRMNKIPEKIKCKRTQMTRENENQRVCVAMTSLIHTIVFM